MEAASSSVTLLPIYRTIFMFTFTRNSNLTTLFCFHLHRWDVPDMYSLHLLCNSAALFYNYGNSMLLITWGHSDTGIGLFTNSKVRENLN